MNCKKKTSEWIKFIQNWIECDFASQINSNLHNGSFSSCIPGFFFAVKDKKTIISASTKKKKEEKIVIVYFFFLQSFHHIIIMLTIVCSIMFYFIFNQFGYMKSFNLEPFMVRIRKNNAEKKQQQKIVTLKAWQQNRWWNAFNFIKYIFFF